MTCTNPLQRCTLLICHKNPPTLRLLLLKMKSWKQSNSETVASAVHNSALHRKPSAIKEENIWMCILFFFYPMRRSVEKLYIFGGEGGLLFCFALLFTCVIVATAWGPGKKAPFIQTLPPPGAQTMCHSLSLRRNRDGAMCLQHVSPPPAPPHHHHHHHHMRHGV